MNSVGAVIWLNAPATASTDDEALITACGDQPRLLCERVFEVSDGNETLARIVEWAVDRPLMIIAILVVAWLLTRVARRVLDRVVTRVVARDRNAVRERLAKVGISASSEPAGVGDDEALLMERAQSRAASISGVLTNTAIITIWTVATILVLGELGVNLAPLIAGAGIAGIALGFGAQSLVSDCLSGVFMLMEDQYGVGDYVDLGEAEGVVEEIALRTTVLRSIDGTVWHVPNGQITRVGNRSQHWSVALVDIDVAYDSDLDVVRALMLDAATELCSGPEWSDVVLSEPEVLGVETLGSDGITVRMTVQTAPGAQWRLQRSLRATLKDAFDAAEIEIPFPQRTLWLRNGAGE